MLSSIVLFLNIGTPELMLIMFVALLLFGGDKLPGLARGLGKGIRDFKDASEGVKREINNQINSYEEKRPVENVTPTAEVTHDITAAEPKQLIDITPVAGTTPLGGQRSTDIDQVLENHAGDANVHTVNGPVDTTHK